MENEIKAKFDFVGLSTDEKPTNVKNGSLYNEVNTAKNYIFYNGSWYELIEGTSVNLQDKTVTITENGTITIEPDENYQGLSSVEVTTNVAGGNIITKNIWDNNILTKNITSISSINISPDMRSCAYMFDSCSSLSEIPLFDTSKITSVNQMFRYCSLITTIPLFDFSEVIYMQETFQNCSHLTSLPAINTSNVQNFQTCFANCTSLVTAPNIDTGKANNMAYMFSGCSNLENVPAYNTTTVSSLGSIFRNCSKLTDDSLNNIMAMCINATHYSGAKALNQLGISNSLCDRCVNLSNYQAFLNAGWILY